MLGCVIALWEAAAELKDGVGAAVQRKQMAAAGWHKKRGAKDPSPRGLFLSGSGAQISNLTPDSTITWPEFDRSSNLEKPHY